MKKPLFILLIIILFWSCSNEFDDITYTITNDSSKTVLFLFNNDLISLNKNEKITYSINSEKDRLAPENIEFSGHKRSVKLEMSNMGTKGIFYTFVDVTCFTLSVMNTLSIPITIKADDFIAASVDTDPDAFDDEDFTLLIKENITEKASIYTSTPNFRIILNDYPVVIEWKFIDKIKEDDTVIEINTIYVIIK